MIDEGDLETHVGLGDGDDEMVEECASAGTFEPRLSIARWWTLFLFSCLSLTNALTWITFAPIAVTVQEAYDVGAIAVNFLSMIFMIAFIPFAFPASWIVDNRSLRLGICVGALLNAGGAAVRVLPWPFADITDTAPTSFTPVAIGQTICAVAQTYILAMPPKLAQNWFGERERVTATAIATLANQLGIAIGFVMGPAIVRETPENISNLLLFQALLCLIALLLVLFFFRSMPSTPPSFSASAAKESKKLLAILWELCQHRSYVILLLCFGVEMGAFYGISTLLGQMLYLLDYDESTTSLLGMTLVLSGIFGAAFCGVAADKTRKYKLLLILFMAGSLLSMVWFSLAAVPDNQWMLVACCIVLGWFMTGILPVSMDTSVEITYPLPEGITANVLVMSAQVFGIIFVLLLTAILEFVEDSAVLVANVTITLAVAAATFAVFFYAGENKRLNAESTAAVQGGGVE